MADFLHLLHVVGSALFAGVFTLMLITFVTRSSWAEVTVEDGNNFLVMIALIVLATIFITL